MNGGAPTGRPGEGAVPLGGTARSAREQHEIAATEALGWLRQVAPSAFSDRRDLHLDSRRLKRGDVFVALRGERVDGRDYLPAALTAGAAAALVDADGWNEPVALTAGVLPTLAVNGLRGTLGFLAAEFYRRPSEHLLSIGVTGTNGKTSSTQWIAQLLTRAGRRCAVIGTIGVGFADEPLTEAPLTTPDPVSLQREVRALLDAGAQIHALHAATDDGVNLRDVQAWLWQHGVQRVLVEAGPRLLTHYLESGFVDQVRVYTGDVNGGRGPSMAQGLTRLKFRDRLDREWGTDAVLEAFLDERGRA